MESTNDYCLMILADSRFAQKGVLDKMPMWIMKHTENDHRNMSIDKALVFLSDFFKEMG
jgi:Rad3-related DNA helicase